MHKYLNGKQCTTKGLANAWVLTARRGFYNLSELKYSVEEALIGEM